MTQPNDQDPGMPATDEIKGMASEGLSHPRPKLQSVLRRRRRGDSAGDHDSGRIGGAAIALWLRIKRWWCPFCAHEDSQ
jgi:hypothetical protein